MCNCCSLVSRWGERGRRPSTLADDRCSLQRNVRSSWRSCAVLALALLAIIGRPATASTQITGVQAVPAGTVSQYEKLEITFQIVGSSTTHPQWPYDPAPPHGIPPGVGITVNAVFTDPEGRQFSQPAFHAEQFLNEVRDGRDWHLPTGSFAWKVRFSPNRPGQWHYRLVAVDQGGTAQSSIFDFSVTASARHGFVKVSKGDSRYFEFDDGTLFNGMGFEFQEFPDFLGDPETRGGPELAEIASYDVNFVRVWISSVFGSAWQNWIGGRNQYRGYLPYTGLTPFFDETTDQTTLAMRLDYEPAGDTGWFDACRHEFWKGREESVVPNATYRVRVEYAGEGITGPRNTSFSNYGLVVKIGGWYDNCYEPGTGTPVTSYGRNTTGFGYIEGYWNSGTSNYLPLMHLGLENVLEGAAYVRSVSLRQELGGGSLGPELMITPSMERQLYIPEERAYSMDKFLEGAERNGIYLKLVLMDLNDKIYLKMEDNGDWVRTDDNLDGFYGLGRRMNKTRWLQQVWWRYLQARWGYSPNIHSWELTNEGDPNLTKHYEIADELGKFMRCRVFGVDPGPGDAAPCSTDHPNVHLVTTSFWQWFPVQQFWKNGKYPNIDYADIHAYVSTSYAPVADRSMMQWDAALFHIWHSQEVLSEDVGKPVVRGEAGLDSTTQQDPNVLGIGRDTTGVWLHNYLWSCLDSGGLYELYWWNDHIWNATFDHRAAYTGVQAFMRDVPLNKGGYVDWGGTVSNPSLRVVGQKNTATGALVLWVQNRQHTWKNVVSGVSVQPASGTVVVPGFLPGMSYSLERWDTYVHGGRIATTEWVATDSSGSLNIPVSSIQTDLALRITSGLSTPTPARDLRILR
jgi:hypothetical protein